MALCLPIIFGFPTKIKPEDPPVGGGTLPTRVCPNCHNASVIAAKSRRWFELFWIPLIPFSSKHIWICGICHWQTEKQTFDPPPAQGGYHHPNQNPNGNQIAPPRQQPQQQQRQQQFFPHGPQSYIPQRPPQHPQTVAQNGAKA